MALVIEQFDPFLFRSFHGDRFLSDMESREGEEIAEGMPSLVDMGLADQGVPAPVQCAVVRPAIGRREREVLLAWFRCDTKAGAARELYVSVNTVKKHIERVRAKYAAAGRPAPTQALLVIRAIQDGWLDTELW